MSTRPSEPSALGRWARIVGPWLVAAAILSWIFGKVPFGEAWAGARNAELGLFLPATILAVGYWFLLESRAFAYLFSRMHVPFSWAEARRLRGVTYLLTPINWNLGTAAIILHLRITRKIGAWQAGSSMMLYGSFDGLILCGLVVLGALALPEGELTAGLAQGAAWFFVGQVVWLALLMSQHPSWRWLTWLRERPLFSAFRRATLRDLGTLLGIRLAYFLGFIGFIWLGAQAFHVDLSFAFAMAATPLVMASGALPITPAGLGTQQAAMLYLFAPYGSEGAILAFGLAFPAALILGRIPIGLLYVRELGELRRHWQQRHELPENETADPPGNKAPLVP